MTVVKWEIPTCWYLSGVHGTQIDATHILFSEEAQLVFLRGFANSQKVPCYCTTCHYMILHVRLESGASWGQMQLLEPFCLMRPQFTPVCCTHSDAIFWTPVRLRENVCLLLRWQCKNILCFWWQNNKHKTVASFTKSEAIQSIFYLWGTRIVYSNNPHTENDLKINSETEVPSISPAEYFTCIECVF